MCVCLCMCACMHMCVMYVLVSSLVVIKLKERMKQLTPKKKKYLFQITILCNYQNFEKIHGHLLQ